MSTIKLTEGNSPGVPPFFKIPEHFPVNIIVFVGRRAPRNCSKSLEETLLDEVATVSAIPFCSRDRLTGSNVFITSL